MLFNTGFAKLGFVPVVPKSGVIKNIPQLYRADQKFARQQNNLFINNFLDKIPNLGFKYCSIDVKVTMLMPGQFPCMPGYHCDEFYRPKGLPDLKNVEAKAPQVHFCSVLDEGTGSLTTFVTNPINLPVLTGRNIYGRYHHKVQALKGKRLHHLQNGEVVRFGPLDFHKGNEATGRGWRCFMRATFSHHREPMNEIRNQVQIYLKDLYEGW